MRLRCLFEDFRKWNTTGHWLRTLKVICENWFFNWIQIKWSRSQLKGKRYVTLMTRWLTHKHWKGRFMSVSICCTLNWKLPKCRKLYKNFDVIYFRWTSRRSGPGSSEGSIYPIWRHNGCSNAFGLWITKTSRFRLCGIWGGGGRSSRNWQHGEWIAF